MWNKSSFLGNAQKLLNEGKSEKIRDFQRPWARIICVKALNKNVTLKARELGDKEVAHLENTYFC